MSETLRTPYTARTESGGPEGPWLIEGPGLHEPWIVPYIGEAAELGRLMNHAYRAALEWAAGQVEAAGCLCHAFNSAEEYDAEFSGRGFKFEGEIDFHGADSPVTKHDPRCPVVRAAQIREGCLERGGRGMYGEHAP